MNANQRRRRRRNWTRAVILGLVLMVVAGMIAALAGCAKIPEAGTVHAGLSSAPSDPNYPEIQPQDPVAGAGPEAIVQGFLQSLQAGSTEGYASARRYLTDQAAAAWDPTGGVNVYSSAGAPEAVSSGQGAELISPVQVTVAYERVGRLDASSRYTSDDNQAEAAFTVVRDRLDRWRIDKLAAGLLLSETEFNAAYVAAPIYYPADTGAFLVPDLRWYPRDDAATDAVQAFLSGPPSWLNGAVQTVLPDGVTLGTITTENGLADVRLDGQVQNVSAAARGLAADCLTQSLLRLGTVRSVQISGGGVWAVPASGAPVADPPPGGGTLMLTGQPGAAGSLEQIAADGSGATPVQGFEALGAVYPATLTVSHDQQQVAGLDASGRVFTLQRGVKSVAIAAEDGAGVAPEFDTFGWLWTGASTGGSGDATTIAVLKGTDTRPLPATWLAGLSLLAIAPARDGTRLAVLMQQPDGSVQLALTAILRDAQGAPYALGTPVEVAALQDPPQAMAWADDITLAVIGGGATAVPELLLTGGPVTTLRTAGDDNDPAVAIAAGPTTTNVVVATRSGAVYTRSGAHWAKLPEAGHLPVVPA